MLIGCGSDESELGWGVASTKATVVRTAAWSSVLHRVRRESSALNGVLRWLWQSWELGRGLIVGLHDF